MPYAEFLEWQEFYEVEPFGVAVDDAAQASIASVIANVNRDPKRRPEPFGLDDFLLFNRREKEAILLDDPDAQTELLKLKLFGAAKSNQG